MKSDEELKQNFKIFVDENDVLNIIGLGFGPESEDVIRAIELVEEEFDKIFNENPQKNYKVLIDLSPMTSTYRNLPTKARHGSYRILKKKQLIKVAVVTPLLIIKVLMRFVSRAARKSGSLNCFSNKEEALKWLKKD